MMSERVAVAMSGGLDSSVAAALLAEQGVDVLGLSMLLWDRSQEVRNGRCCGSLDLADARRVAQQVGIPHYTLRLDDEFERAVVDPFVDDYLAGRTPSPCVRCNTWIKFDAFVDRARALGAEKVATGHYARVLYRDDEWQLHEALDRDKDQSYYLFELGQHQLARALFPLGERTKGEVREEARRRELVVAEKGESMEVCFVSGAIQDFVEERLEEVDTTPAPSSEVVDESGRGIGRSDPYYRFTVGQRRGLGIASHRPLYVLEIDAAHNRLVAGPRESLASGGLSGRGLHWVGRAPEGEIEAEVRIRSRHPGVRCCIRATGDGEVEVDFAEPQDSVAPGQAAVFYRGSQVLGGCWIVAGRPRSAGSLAANPG
jgi:tRNA-specific 2-thiouridylase